MTADGVGAPVRLRRGYWDGVAGTYYGWPIDGYIDLHHVADGDRLDGSEVIGEGYGTMADARAAARTADREDPARFTAALARGVVR